MTVAGTLSHELGHFVVARSLGYQAAMNYQSTWHWTEESIDLQNKTSSIQHEPEFSEKKQHSRQMRNHEKDNFWITLGGPLQTMLTGTIACLVLFLNRKKLIAAETLSLTAWTLIFLSLFWLRQIANLLIHTGNHLLNKESVLRSDEIRLAEFLNLNPWSIQIATGSIGVGVLLLVLRLLPKNLVFTFLISGMVGSGTGYYLWLIRLGPIVMP